MLALLMRVRLQTTAAVTSLADAFERAGGTVHVSGDTVELVHPGGDSATHDACELEFFVRAWALGAERAHTPRLAPEILPG
jgi:hypothetical protein